MRIGIIGDAIDRQYAGIHYFTKNLVHGLGKIDKDNEYFLIREAEGAAIEGVKQVVIRSKKIPFARVFRIFRQIPRKAKELRLDVVIEPAHFGPFNLDEHVKKITVVHDMSPVIHSQWHPFLSAFLQKIFLPSIIRKADLVITNSSFSKSEIERLIKISSQKVVFAHLGISEIFKPTVKPSIQGQYGIYKKYILYQGTIEPRKNLLNLIRAYELYRHANPQSNIQLIISGKTGWKATKVIKKKYDSLYRDDIILLGYVERNDMPALYSGASLFVYPSFYEGFGLPVLEALACGIPVIASNSSSIPEVADRFAKYFDPHNIQDISNCIEEGLERLHKKEEQIEFASSFTWENTARKVLEAVKAL